MAAWNIRDYLSWTIRLPTLSSSFRNPALDGNHQRVGFFCLHSRLVVEVARSLRPPSPIRGLRDSCVSYHVVA